MWFDIGFSRLLLLVIIVVSGLALGRRGRLWLTAVGPLALLSALVPGTDPLGMLIAMALLLAIFALGVYWGPRLRNDEKTESPESDNA